MSDHSPITRVPDWRELDISTIPEGAAIDGFQSVDDIEIFTRVLGAQMLSLMYTGSIDSTRDYIAAPAHWANTSVGRRGKSVSERFYHDVQAPMGDEIAFAESTSVFNLIRRPNQDNAFYRRPSRSNGQPWVRDVHIVTSTRLVHVDTGNTKGFAGLSVRMNLWRTKGGPSVQRTFTPGVRLATRAEKLFPNTTTF